MGDYTDHFSEWEFACSCCGACEMDLDHVMALEALRVLAGCSIRVNSGYRCAIHNKRVGGAPYSQHLCGLASDIVITKKSVLEMLALAEQIPAFKNGGIGIYPQKRFVHVDNRDVRARWGVCARWGWLHGRMVSIEDAITYLKLKGK